MHCYASRPPNNLRQAPQGHTVFTSKIVTYIKGNGGTWGMEDEEDVPLKNASFDIKYWLLLLNEVKPIKVKINKS
uniref:Uncharacterized protein n=1 Tax=Ascaris lumbricoides TaxID=6252 RepID=A0A0M3IFR5_ASCLU